MGISFTSGIERRREEGGEGRGGKEDFFLPAGLRVLHSTISGKVTQRTVWKITFFSVCSLSFICKSGSVMFLQIFNKVIYTSLEC